MKKFNIFAVVGICLCLVLVSCATSKKNAWEPVDVAIAQDDFSGGIDAIVKGQESKKKPVYAKGNAISLFLDKGLLEHYAGKYADSSNDLQDAERLIGEAFTKSVSADVASYIANDNTKEYAGEDFEDIYLNVFNALNYYNSGDLEGAQVEIRKLSMSSGKLDMLERKYENAGPNVGEWMMAQFAKIGLSVNPELPQGKSVQFSNSALARYLSTLFYLGDGKTDDARIEFEQIQKAFSANPNIYTNPVPQSVAEDLKPVAAGSARLNVIGFAGLSPVKVEDVFVGDFTFLQVPVALLSNGNDNGLSGFTPLWQPNFRLPKITSRPSSINRIEVIVGEDKFNLELLEDMGAVMAETFNAKFSNLFLKTYIRTVGKYAAVAIAAVQAGNKVPDNFKGATTLASAAAGVAGIYASEGADVRMARYFPDKAYVGNITLAPGTYTVTVNYYSGDSLVSSETKHDVAVKANSLNLVEGFCLK